MISISASFVPAALSAPPSIFLYPVLTLLLFPSSPLHPFLTATPTFMRYSLSVWKSITSSQHCLSFQLTTFEARLFLILPSDQISRWNIGEDTHSHQDRPLHSWQTPYTGAALPVQLYLLKLHTHSWWRCHVTLRGLCAVTNLHWLCSCIHFLKASLDVLPPRVSWGQVFTSHISATLVSSQHIKGNMLCNFDAN